MDKKATMEKVVEALKTLRVGKVIAEKALQNEIEKVFHSHGISHLREYALDSRSRVDFLVDGVVVEVKKGKPNREMLSLQINRYAEFDFVDAVIIVVETSLFSPITKTWNGKPCVVIGLQKQWGIAL